MGVNAGGFYNTIPDWFIDVPTAAKAYNLSETAVIEKCRKGELKAVFAPPFTDRREWFIETTIGQPGTVLTVDRRG